MRWDELKNRINQKQQKLTINLKDSEFGEELIYNIKIPLLCCVHKPYLPKNQ